MNYRTRIIKALLFVLILLVILATTILIVEIYSDIKYKENQKSNFQKIINTPFNNQQNYIPTNYDSQYDENSNVTYNNHTYETYDAYEDDDDLNNNDQENNNQYTNITHTNYINDSVNNTTNNSNITNITINNIIDPEINETLIFNIQGIKNNVISGLTIIDFEYVQNNVDEIIILMYPENSSNPLEDTNNLIEIIEKPFTNFAIDTTIYPNKNYILKIAVQIENTADLELISSFNIIINN